MRNGVLGLLIAVGVISLAPGFVEAKGVSQSAVLGACTRTAGCQMTGCNGGSVTNTGCVQGCSPNACFKCNKGKCVQTRGLGGKPVAGGGNLTGIRDNAPTGNTVSSTGSKPVDVTPAPGGTGQGGRKH